MRETSQSKKVGLPKAHGACALVCFAGAMATCFDWPSPAPQHGSVFVPAVLIWGVAALYQFLLAAGHLRTSILDHQHLFGSGPYESKSDFGWMVANVLVLIVVAMFYARQAESIPLLAGQATTLVSLLVTSLISLAVWGVRWKALALGSRHSL
ncbi:hypothetical protein [Bremerella cremea]|uniref:hypothetical protein n=1 Tax=Bremerella cremea TaxID=1031537 RepID=UPI001F28B492|nr:hypothetical protein [Bremerella cremea]